MSETLKISTTEGMTKIQIHALVNSEDIALKTVAPIFDFENPSRAPTELAEILLSKMKEYGGIGLSSCQLGIKERAFSMGIGDEVVVFFNPEIIEQSSQTDYEVEGCLSFPNIYVGVNRSVWVKVKYQSFDGKTLEKSFTGLTARCFQHETDHLNGITFLDRAGNLAKKLAFKRKQKIEKTLVNQVKNMQKNRNAQLKVVSTTPLLQNLFKSAGISEPGPKKTERAPYTKHLISNCVANAINQAA